MVVPVYGNRDTLPEVVRALEHLQELVRTEVEAVFVIDGSPDDSFTVLRAALPGAAIRAQLLAHSRNFGAFEAIRTGLRAARGEFVAVMAADLQEPVELVATMFERLRSGEADVAVGTRTARDDPRLSRMASRTFWRVYRRLIQRELPVGGVDIFACTRQVAGTLGDLSESHSSLIGQLYWVGYRRVEVPYARRRRSTGKSAWTLRKRVTYVADSVFSFTDLPIKLLLTGGLLGTLVTLITAFVVLVAWLTGAVDVPGYTATMLVLLLGTGSILSALGVVGTYVWRTYENSKQRPNAIVMSRETFDEIREG